MSQLNEGPADTGDGKPHARDGRQLAAAERIVEQLSLFDLSTPAEMQEGTKLLRELADVCTPRERPPIDVAELRELADQHAAEKQRKAREDEHKEALRAQQITREGEAAAETIFASIPDALRKAARKPVREADGLFVIASIPVAAERNTSSYVGTAVMSEVAKATLQAVQDRLPTFGIPGIEITLKESKYVSTFYSADGLDSSDSECLEYNLEAKARIG